MAKQNIMTVASLKKLLEQLENELSDDYHVWLSSDEEGNQYLPMYESTELCLEIDKEEKKIIFLAASWTKFK